MIKTNENFKNELISKVFSTLLFGCLYSIAFNTSTVVASDEEYGVTPQNQLALKGNENPDELACEENCLISENQLTPFVAQKVEDWSNNTVAEVRIPSQKLTNDIREPLRNLTVKESNSLENSFACEENCLISGNQLTPFVAQRVEDWSDATVAEVKIPTQTSTNDSETALPNLSARTNNTLEDNFACEENCLISEEQLTPFVAQNLSNYNNSTVAEVKPVDRILVPEPPETTIEEEIKPDPTTEEPIQPEKPTIKVTPQLTDKLVENAIRSTAERYPWIVNGSDKLSFSAAAFQPKAKEFYLNLDLRISEDNPFLNKLGFGGFPYDDQLYWVLENNIIIGNIAGGFSGLTYQGKQTNQTLEQRFTSIQSFTGYQAVWVIPNDLQRLLKIEDLDDYQIISLGGELINPEGRVAQGVEFNTEDIIRDDQDVIIFTSFS